MVRSLFRNAAVTAISLAVAFSTIVPGEAQTPAPAIIEGSIVTQDNGLPIGGAKVDLYRGNVHVVSTTTNGDGRYLFTDEVPDVYRIVISDVGFQTTEISDIVAVSGETADFSTALLRAGSAQSSGALREIGATSASARGNTLASTTTIQYNLNPDQLQAQGFFKAADALGQVPGVNISGSPHSVGDDTSIDIRGLGPGEVRPLLDGHPVGPIGVDSPDYYDYANSPYFLLSNIGVTLGSGASGLYGVDVIGGTIDFQTLNPTTKPHGELYQALGNEDLAQTEIKTTGSFGKFGYALGHTVEGTTGDFAPQQIVQGARPNNSLNLTDAVPGSSPLVGQCTGSNDLTSCNTALNTYSVSGNYRVQNDLGKLKYDFNDKTSLTLTAYDGNQLSDSTGNGDNDDIPYDTRLAEIQANPGNCNGGKGYTVITNSNPNACYTAQQYAAASSGPYGGGQDRNRGTSLQDYHARFSTLVGNNQISLDYFDSYYDFRKNSNEASGLDPTGTYFIGGGTYQDEYLTHGFLASDDIAGRNNDFGFGYFVEHQREYGNNLSAGNYDPTQGPIVLPSFVPQSELGSGDFSYFIRDQYIPSSLLGFYLNAWQRYSNVTEKATFDPRLSVVLKPTHHDVVRLTAGRADGDPSVSIKQGGLSGFGNPSSLNPSCTLLNSVASSGDPNLQPESSNDYEVGYGHRFWSDTAINAVGYVSEVRNQFFSGIAPLSSIPGGTTNSLIDLPGYAQKIGQACGVNLTATTVIPYLGVSQTYNAASGLFRGIELTGRLRATPQFYLDGEYDIQSAQQTGISATNLAANPFIINNAQIYEIPVHKANLTADYNNLHGFEAQLEGYYVGDNNTLNRPAYTFFNGFVSKTLEHNLTASVGITNVFNQDVQLYGYFGHQLFAPENQYATNSANSIQQAVNFGNSTALEELGLSPRVVTVSVNLKI
jgi:outer membrane receptor protein involved in Fe transport